MGTSSFCDQCGARNRVGAKFCAGCGAAIASAAMPSPRPEDLPTTPRPAVPQELREAFLPDLVLEQPIGRGGMGVVYLAHETGLDRKVAVKVLPEADAENPAAAERFLREARTAAKLRHPNIVAIHQVGVRRGRSFFTMDFIEGRTLGQVVQAQGPLPAAEACRIMACVADALAQAHRSGVVHRDVKPPNVMVQQDGHVFVMDFGLAKRQGTASLTESGTIHGTPEYLSPEQAHGQPATAASDAYAFGLALFFVLAGRHLVTGDSIGAIVARHLTASFAAEIERESNVPASLRPLLGRLLERDPSRRTDALEAVAAELRRGATVPVPDVGSLPDTRTVALRTSSQEAQVPLTPTPSGPRSPRTPASRRARERLSGLLDKLGPASEPSPRPPSDEEDGPS